MEDGGKRGGNYVYDRETKITRRKSLHISVFKKRNKHYVLIEIIAFLFLKNNLFLR